MRKTLVLVIVLFFSLLHSLQASISRLSFYTPAQNRQLINQNISSITQDYLGFIWVGTEKGVMRYDGARYETPNELKFLESFPISAVAVRGKQLLIGTMNSGFYIYDLVTKSINQFAEQNTDSNLLVNDRVFDIHVDNEGDIWVGTFTGVTRITTAGPIHIQNNPVDPTSIPAGRVTKIIDGLDDALLFVIDGSISDYDPVTEVALTKTFEDIPFQAEIYSVSPYRGKGYWLATNLGAYLVDLEGKVQVHLDDTTELRLADKVVLDVFTDQQSNCWFLLAEGIDWLDNQRKLHHVTQDVADSLSLRSVSVTAIFQDDQSNIWLGQLNNGPAITNTQLPFARLKHTPFEPDSLAHNYIFDIHAANENSLIISTANGINEYQTINDRNNKLSVFNKSGLSTEVKPLRMEADSFDRIWMIDQENKLHVAKRRNAQLHLLDDPNVNELVEFEIEALSNIQNNLLWLASLREIILVDVRLQDKAKVFSLNAITDWPVTDISLQGDMIWLGTFGGGIRGVRLNPDLSLDVVFDSQIYVELDGLDVRQVKMFGNTLLAATQRGLVAINTVTKAFQIVDESSGLPDQNLIALDFEEDTVWLASLKRISKVKLFPRVSVENFDPTVGIPNIEFSRIAVVENQPWVYLATSSGLYAVNKQRGFAANPLQKPKLTKLNVENRNEIAGSYLMPKTLQLAYNQNDVRVEFSHMDYRPVKRYSYQTRLKGFRDQWQNQEEAFAFYTNLDKGRYAFEVRALDNVTGDLSPIESIQFHITPPLWFSVPAYVMYGLLFCGALFGLYASYHRKLAEQKEIANHLRNLDQMKDEFLANTSHELKTPLNGIIGLSESLLEGVAGEISPKIKEHLQLISKSGQRLSSLVEEILDHKQLEKGTLSLHLKPCDVRTLSDIVLDMCRPLSDKKQISLINNIPKKQVYVLADENRFQQIMFNLVSNAIKYSSDGDIVLECKLSEEQVVIEVTDHGCGIAQEKIAAIFNPFERLGSANQGTQGGTGLGLSVTKALVELHHGKIEVMSQLNKGSTFSVYLPRSFDKPIHTNEMPLVTRVVETSDVQPSAEISHTIESQHRDEIILVVDDEPVNLKVASDSLKLKGYRVIETTSGYTALELLQKHSIALIVLDVMMPEISGFEVCRRVRKSKTEIELPILLLSARNSAKDVATGMDAGANDYISKPINQLELITRVGNLLEMRKLIDLERQRQLTETTEKTYQKLRQYFPRAVVDYIVKNRDTNIAAEKRQVTILFSDLVNFTKLSNALDPTVITALLSEYVEQMATVVEKHQGVMNEILGDGLVVLFGAPTEMGSTEQAKSALACSIEMHQKLQELNLKWQQSSIAQNIEMRIGIHQDYVTAGSIGSKAYRAYRAVGIGVNLASRIQTEALPSSTLVSECIYQQGKSHFSFSKAMSARLKGIEHKVKIYQVLGKS